MARRFHPASPFAAPVLIACADSRRRATLRDIVGAARMRVVGSAGGVDAALGLAAELRPAVCVLDLRPADVAQAVLEEILDAVPDTRVILVADPDETAGFLAAMRAGAAGYVGTEDPDDVLVRALTDVLAGRPALPARLLPALVGELRAA